MSYAGSRRKVFISHFKGNRSEAEEFIQKFGNEQKVFSPYVLDANDNDDFINSSDPAYVMQQVRKKYLQDTTVTIALLGSRAHSPQIRRRVENGV